MKRKHWFRIILAFWFGLWVGLAYADIGEASQSFIYDWKSPFTIAGFIFVTAYLGFMSNAKDLDDNDRY